MSQVIWDIQNQHKTPKPELPDQMSRLIMDIQDTLVTV
jgi:hypothetical protein